MRLFGKWPCFAQIADSLKHQPVAVYKKLGKDMGRHGKSSKFHRGGNFSLCGKIDSQRMEIRRLSRIVEDWNLGYLEFAFSVSNIFSQNGGERWWGKHGNIRKRSSTETNPGCSCYQGCSLNLATIVRFVGLFHLFPGRKVWKTYL